MATRKSVFITGCSAGGIGFALAVAFQKRGLHVFASARSLSKMSDLRSLTNVTLIELDVTSSTSISSALDIVSLETSGKLDILVNNSGIQDVMPLLDMDMEDAKALFDVNFFGVIAVTQAFAPLIIARKGSIINISSISGLLHAPWMSVYNASKAALTMLGETFRLEMAPFGVKVASIITGIVKTNIMTHAKDLKLPPASIYKPAEEMIWARANGEDIKSRMKTEDFAEKVVGDIMAGATGKVYRGEISSATRFLSSSIPSSVLDSILTNGTGIDVLGKAS